MRKQLIIVVLFLTICSGLTLAQNVWAKAENTAIPTSILDVEASSWGPLDPIVDLLNKADSWFQQNFW